MYLKYLSITRLIFSNVSIYYYVITSSPIGNILEGQLFLKFIKRRKNIINNKNFKKCSVFDRIFK